MRGLYELRAALELEAAHLALERHGGRLPEPVHAALAALEAACAGPDPAWSDVSHAHAALHGAIVAASESPRIVAAHAALTGELLLFLLQLQPHVDAAGLAADHARARRGARARGAGRAARPPAGVGRDARRGAAVKRRPGGRRSAARPV